VLKGKWAVTPKSELIISAFNLRQW